MRANPDGYTIEMGQIGTRCRDGALPNLAYKPDVDFEPIGMVSTIPALIVARKDFLLIRPLGALLRRLA
jgi:tripartite-type tricarboxylate transporter receptor subunit TctC